MTRRDVSRSRIEPELGAGGTATVYLAEDLQHLSDNLTGTADSSDPVQ